MARYAGPPRRGPAGSSWQAASTRRRASPGGGRDRSMRANALKAVLSLQEAFRQPSFRRVLEELVLKHDPGLQPGELERGLQARRSRIRNRAADADVKRGALEEVSHRGGEVWRADGNARRRRRRKRGRADSESRRAAVHRGRAGIAREKDLVRQATRARRIRHV